MAEFYHAAGGAAVGLSQAKKTPTLAGAFAERSVNGSGSDSRTTEYARSEDY